MANTTITVGPDVERYREAERELWNHYGLEPTERFVEIESPAVRLRLLEVGSGEPVLFVHGTIGPAWPPLVRELSGFRSLILDRPGWGLSSPLDFSRYEYEAVVGDLLRGVLDALGIERANVVGGSIGNVWALRLAERYPSRVAGAVLLGSGPLLPDIAVPAPIQALASPAGEEMVRFPTSPERVREMLRGGGHGASLDAGTIPVELIEWRSALGTYTDSMVHERSMVQAIVDRTGYRPGLTFEDSELAAIERPILLVYGTADPLGSAETWRRFTDLLPNGELRLLDGFGHQPWLDDPSGVAGHVGRFLTRTQRETEDSA
jgi:pimeloyl-ACP methyl ester carboxylesterase